MGNGNREGGTASGRESVGWDEKGQTYCTAVVIDTCIDIARAKDKVTVLLARRPSGPLLQSKYSHFPSCKTTARPPRTRCPPLAVAVGNLILSSNFYIRE